MRSLHNTSLTALQEGSLRPLWWLWMRRQGRLGFFSSLLENASGTSKVWINIAHRMSYSEDCKAASPGELLMLWSVVVTGYHCREECRLITVSFVLCGGFFPSLFLQVLHSNRKKKSLAVCPVLFIFSYFCQQVVVTEEGSKHCLAKEDFRVYLIVLVYLFSQFPSKSQVAFPSLSYGWTHLKNVMVILQLTRKWFRTDFLDSLISCVHLANAVTNAS